MEKKFIIVKMEISFSGYRLCAMTHKVVNAENGTAKPLLFDTEEGAAEHVKTMGYGYFEIRPVYHNPWVDKGEFNRPAI